MPTALYLTHYKLQRIKSSLRSGTKHPALFRREQCLTFHMSAWVPSSSECLNRIGRVAALPWLGKNRSATGETTSHMEPSSFNRTLLPVYLAVALLCACSRVDVNPIAASGQHSASVIGPNTLMYISSQKKASVYIEKYPGGKPWGTLIGFYAPTGLCSDAQGNVWVTDTDPYTNTGYLDEYAHGEKHPIVTLTDANNSPLACSVDTTTGNLAVVNSKDSIAIYSDGREPATLYSTVGIVHKPNTITYDNAGNLYLASSSDSPAWLPARSSTIKQFRLKPRAPRRGPIGWDGQYLTVLVSAGSQSQVWRYQLMGGHAKRIGIVDLDECCIRNYAIDGSLLAATMPKLNQATVIKYPAGGGGFFGLTASDPFGIAISRVAK